MSKIIVFQSMGIHFQSYEAHLLARYSKSADWGYIGRCALAAPGELRKTLYSLKLHPLFRS